jgi:hypothetical protein
MSILESLLAFCSAQIPSHSQIVFITHSSPSRSVTFLPSIVFAKFNVQVLRQFPDCRFVYVLFRSRTLGYDVYPEDYFLRTFPWQQYGGLWVVDEARFARAVSMDTLTAQTLRHITGEGASPHTSYSDSPINPISPTSPTTDSSFYQLPTTNDHMRGIARSRFPSFLHSFDSSINSFPTSTQDGGSGTPSEVGSPIFAPPQLAAAKPQLTLLTDVGRRYPGFPTPLSPTLSAKDLFPSPASDGGSWVGSPRAMNPAISTLSATSLDGSEMRGPSFRCSSHGYENHAVRMGLIDSILAQPITDYGLATPPPTPPFSPTSPISPRTAMFESRLGRKLHGPAAPLAPGLQYHPSTVNVPGTFANAHTHPMETVYPQSLNCSSPLAPAIQIANGTEAELGSPLSASGTMLSYTSNRTVDSGLLAVPPLSEPRVAEYRFWIPCGRRICAFGCGVAHEGEVAASKRLFKEIEEVKEQAEVDSSREPFGQYEAVEADDGGKSVSVDQAKSSAAINWARFLKNREREGIASV